MVIKWHAWILVNYLNHRFLLPRGGLRCSRVLNNQKPIFLEIKLFKNRVKIKNQEEKSSKNQEKSSKIKENQAKSIENHRKM